MVTPADSPYFVVRRLGKWMVRKDQSQEGPFPCFRDAASWALKAGISTRSSDRAGMVVAQSGRFPAHILWLGDPVAADGATDG